MVCGRNFRKATSCNLFSPCWAPITDEAAEAAVVLLVRRGVIDDTLGLGVSAALVYVGGDGISGNVQSVEKMKVWVVIQNSNTS